jgi:hypothetical protein
MDKPTHKRQDTPIIRDKLTKRRLMAYELSIQTRQLSDHTSDQIRVQSRSNTPEQMTRSLPVVPHLLLQRVTIDGRDYFVRPEDLIASPDLDSASSTRAEPPTPRQLLLSAQLLDLAAIPELSLEEPCTHPNPAPPEPPVLIPSRKP